MNKIPTYEEACATMGEDIAYLPDTTGRSEIRAKQIIADHKLDILHKATNRLDNNFKPDFNDGNQDKYTPWLRWVPSLSAFVCSGSGCTRTGTDLGARFWFRSTNTAREFFETHSELINDLHRQEY